MSGLGIFCQKVCPICPQLTSVPGDRNSSCSILSRKAYLGEGKRLSLLVGPTTCGLAFLTIQSTLPHSTAKCMLYLQPTHSPPLPPRTRHGRRELLGPAETTWSGAAGVCWRWVGAHGGWGEDARPYFLGDVLIVSNMECCLPLLQTH